MSSGGETCQRLLVVERKSQWSIFFMGLEDLEIWLMVLCC
jgi:hypothetical protein